MERLIQVLLFSGLWPFTQSMSRGYVLIQDLKIWDEAQAYCRQNHIDLATVQSTEDWADLQETAQLATTSVWTGLYDDINSWRWSYKDENITFTAWGNQEPNNGRESFAAIGYDKWYDMQNSVYPFICFNENKTGADRFVFTSTVTLEWEEAQSYCRQHHTDLAIIRSQDENNQLTNMVKGFTTVWIGLYRDSWKWSDGTNISTSPINWMNGQPSMTGLNRPCGALGPDGRIYDRLCSDVLPFICMHNAKKQIVRLEVKSLQNVNDPAVMETISQWMKQKLNTNLSWRVQPDGNVFSPKPGARK